MDAVKISSAALALFQLVLSVAASISANSQRMPTVSINDGSRELVNPFNVQSLPKFGSSNMTSRHQDIRISTRVRNINLFSVDQRGNLVTTDVIDLESMCSTSGLCCKNVAGSGAECGAPDAPSCCIELWLFPPDHPFQDSLLVKVTDVNEYQPHFPNVVEEVQIFENLRGTVVLPAPIDEDFSQRFLFLFLRGPDTGLFSDRFPMRIDSSASRITLNLARELDREVRDSYRFQVLACEKERADSRCGTVNVTLHVQDVNDNPPRFNMSSRMANFSVRETRDHETYIATLSAHDRDEAENAHVNYQIDGEAKCVLPGSAIGSACWSKDDRNNEHTVFEMRNGGELFVQGALDYEQCRKYSLVVRASNSHPSTFSDSVEVVVNVLDVDDTRPCVRWVPSSSVSIQENKTPGQELSSVMMVSDLDTPLSQVTCEVQQSHDFRLRSVPSNATEVPYLLVANRAFNRENEPEMQVNVRCVDLGNVESLSNEWSVLDVTVLDMNDNAPEFEDGGSFGTDQPKVLEAEIAENSPSGTPLRMLSAKDLDASVNAEVEYSFANASAYQFFNLDAQTGNLTSAAALDYETTKDLRFVVLAVDRGSPRLTGTATLLVHVNNVNDNAPEFTQKKYQFTMRENTQVNYLVGSVSAHDRDSNQTITYRLLEAQDHFLISSEKGDIFVYHPLDRETLASDRYTLTVVANDSVHTATTYVEVIVEDQNDCAPQFVYPTAENSTVRLSCPPASQCSSPQGCLVLQVRTTDCDASELHTTASYSIVNSTYPDAFRINSATGEVFYRHEASRDCFDMAKLTIEARDMVNSGEAGLTSSLSVFVVFMKEAWHAEGAASQALPSHDGTLQTDGIDSIEGGFITTHQLMIILVVSAAFVVCAVGLLLVLLMRIRVRKVPANDDDVQGGAHRHTGCDLNAADDTQSQMSSQSCEIAHNHKHTDAEKLHASEYCGTLSMCSDAVALEIESNRAVKAESPYFTKNQLPLASKRGTVARRLERTPATLTGSRAGLKTSATPTQPYIYYSITNGSTGAPAECDSPLSHTTNSCFECSMQRQFTVQMKQSNAEDEHAYASAAEYDPACSCPDCLQVRLASQQTPLPISFSQQTGSDLATLKCASVHMAPGANRYNSAKPTLPTTMFNPIQSRNFTLSMTQGDETAKNLLIQRSDGYLTTLPRRKPDGNNNAVGEKPCKPGSKLQHTAACPPDCENPRCVVSYV